MKTTLYKGEWIHIYTRGYGEYYPSKLTLEVGGWEMVAHDLSEATNKAKTLEVLDDMIRELQVTKIKLLEETVESPVPE